MTHTPGRLHVGVDANGGYGQPDPFWREIGEKVEFEIEAPCYVVFDDNDFFDDVGYNRPRPHDRKPKKDKNTTIYYNVIEYDNINRRYSKLGSHSIKIGSGLLSKSKKAKAKAKHKTKSLKSKK